MPRTCPYKGVTGEGRSSAQWNSSKRLSQRHCYQCAAKNHHVWPLCSEGLSPGSGYPNPSDHPLPTCRHFIFPCHSDIFIFMLLLPSAVSLTGAVKQTRSHAGSYWLLYSSGFTSSMWPQEYPHQGATNLEKRYCEKVVASLQWF